MSELPHGMTPATLPEPRESALGVVVRPGPDGIEVLLGLRARRSGFLPGNLAFPGGGVEPEDGPGDAEAHRRCATRELREETGIEIAPERWLPAGLRITPALFAVRFRTLFYLAAVPPGTPLPTAPPTVENERLAFERPADVLRAFERGEARVAPPVLAVLRALAGHDDAAPERLAEAVGAANGAEQDAPRIEFVPDVWVLPMRTATLPPATHTNAWIPSGERFAVIDPGSGDPDEVDRLLRVLRRLSSAGRTAAAVLLTHHHRDHVGGAAEVAFALSVPVRAHASVLERLGERLADVEAVAIEPGETLDLGGLTLSAVLTEGHARGHLAFRIPERGALVSGDLVSALSTILVDPPEGDMDRFLETLSRVEKMQVDTLLPGHGPPVPRIAAARTREHRERREAQVLAAVAGGEGRIAAIARTAYADTPDAPPALAERQTLAHLERLRKAGRLQVDGGRWLAV